MSANEQNAYILGTEKAELHRLGLQHQVWSSEARKGWEIAEFSEGQTILDLGCGPGFCTMELAYLVGEEGKVIGVDLSQNYIDFLQQSSDQHGVDIELICCDFNDLELEEDSLDGVYCRWALAWIDNPEEILIKLKKALKPGGRMVIQEYYDWSTHQTEPNLSALTKGIAAALQSFKDSPGNIDVGRELPLLFDKLGMIVQSTRPLAKITRPHEATWQWPKSFLEIYIPKLIEMGLITQDESDSALEELAELSLIPEATYFCPMMIEVVAVNI